MNVHLKQNWASFRSSTTGVGLSKENLLPMCHIISKHKQTTFTTIFSDSQLMRNILFQTKSKLRNYLKNRKICISFLNEEENLRACSFYCIMISQLLCLKASTM